MTNMTVIILTKNEETDIVRCIRSVKEWVQRIVIVDSGSTDRTCELAAAEGAEVVKHEPFIDYAKQFNWAIDNLDITTTWVFRLDADEVVTPELRKELEKKLECHATDDVSGFMMRYKVHFLGRYLRHGGFYPFLKITIFKKCSLLLLGGLPDGIPQGALPRRIHGCVAHASLLRYQGDNETDG